MAEASVTRFLLVDASGCADNELCTGGQEVWAYMNESYLTLTLIGV